MKMTTLSRRHWRELIRAHLERWDPIHSRWLQEHPRQTEILNEVVTDAIDVWCQAMAARQDPNWPPDPWTRLDLDELEELIVARTVETPELWEDLAETYPRTAAPVAAGTDRSDAAAGDPAYRPDTAALAPSSLTDRARRNLTALATLDHIDQRGGVVTDHDRARLGLWTGWGALPQLFDPTVDREPFAGLRRDLEQRLDTRRAARRVGVDAQRPLHRPGGDRRRVAAVHRSRVRRRSGVGAGLRQRPVHRSRPRRGAPGEPLRRCRDRADHGAHRRGACTRSRRSGRAAWRRCANPTAATTSPSATSRSASTPCSTRSTTRTGPASTTTSRSRPCTW